MPTIRLYTYVFAAFTALLLTLFRLGALSHEIFFYRGIALMCIAFVLIISGFLTMHYIKGVWRVESIIAATIIAASLHLAFFITVPVTLDRSISIFLLNDIASHPQGLNVQDLTNDFISGYVRDGGAIGRRIIEQNATGDIVAASGTIRLSERGRFVLDLGDLIRKLYGI